jgi:hypothetical protein
MNRRFGSSHRLRELSGYADRSSVSRLAVFRKSALKRKARKGQAIRYAGWAMIGAAALIAIFPGLNDVIIHFLE